METIITLVVSAICIGLTVMTIRSYLARKIMNARRFAGFFAIGSSVTLLVFFFLPFILESRPLELEVIALGWDYGAHFRDQLSVGVFFLFAFLPIAQIRGKVR